MLDGSNRLTKHFFLFYFEQVEKVNLFHLTKHLTWRRRGRLFDLFQHFTDAITNVTHVPLFNPLNNDTKAISCLHFTVAGTEGQSGSVTWSGSPS